MSVEQISVLQPLVLSAFWLIAIGTVIGLTRFYFAGTGKLPYARLTPGASQGPSWYASLNRTYINGIEAFALAAPSFILHIVLSTQLSNASALAWGFLVARVLYTLVYVGGGYKIWVSLVWLIGFACTILSWALLLI